MKELLSVGVFRPLKSNFSAFLRFSFLTPGATRKRADSIKICFRVIISMPAREGPEAISSQEVILAGVLAKQNARRCRWTILTPESFLLFDASRF